MARRFGFFDIIAGAPLLLLMPVGFIGWFLLGVGTVVGLFGSGFWSSDKAVRGARMFLGATLGSALGIFGLSLGAAGVAEAAGCTLNASGAHACVVWGADIGETLYTFSMMHWLVILTFPFIAVAASAWFATVAARLKMMATARNTNTTEK